MRSVNNNNTAKYISQIETNYSCSYTVKRLSGYKFVKPLMFVDDPCEEDALASTKQEINSLIENYKVNNGVISASVYLKDYDANGWMAVNENEKYEPGSLFKVPVMIAYLKMSEQNPGLLDEELKYDKAFNFDVNVAFKSRSIQVGKSYKIRELIRYMIQYSDNNATNLLTKYLNNDVFEKIFEDFGIKKPDILVQKFNINCIEFSIFMRSLYNASYLSIDNSEFAAELLSKSEFNEGIKRVLPKDINVISKFGESGTNSNLQLHETAIVYLKNRPYLLTVMTKGKDNKSLLNLISEISKITYANMNKS